MNFRDKAFDCSSNAMNEVQQVVEQMSDCVGQMAQMLDALRDIHTKSHKIKKAANAIDDIAFQANILSLKTALEAVESGSHGTGFTIVEAEVRNLASKSTEVSIETRTLIEKSYNSIYKSIQIVGKVNESFSSIAEMTQKCSGNINTVYSFSTNRLKAIRVFSRGLFQMVQVVQQIKVFAQECADLSRQIDCHTEVLKQLTDKFDIEGLR